MHAGAANLRKQIENIRLHGVSPVVAINAFPDDHASEHEAIRRDRRVEPAPASRSARTSPTAARGATELAEAVAEAAERAVGRSGSSTPTTRRCGRRSRPSRRRCTAPTGWTTTCAAARQLDTYERNGFGQLPVCIAKTHLSISSDPTLKGAPTGWRLPVREVRASVGAGFVYPICGDMRTMPGLGRNPAAHHIDIDENGEIMGLS